MSSFKFLVIGDSCLDRFVYGHCNRLCPEGPVPVFKPSYNTENLGMAGNVATNLIALGASTSLITNENHHEMVKMRYVEIKSNHLLLRVDSNDKCQAISTATLKGIRFADFDCVVVADYNKGFLSEDNLQYIGSQSKISFVDTKKPIGYWATFFSFIKINEKEYNATKETADKYAQNKVIVTRGELGCSLNGDLYLAKRTEVLDVSGAGDTFMAALAFKFIESGHHIVEAMRFANAAASSVVSQRGVTTVNPCKL